MRQQDPRADLGNVPDYEDMAVAVAAHYGAGRPLACRERLLMPSWHVGDGVYQMHAGSGDLKDIQVIVLDEILIPGA